MRRLIVAATHPGQYPWGLRPWTRHSLVLAVAGCVYIAVGCTYLLATPVGSRESALQVAINLMSLRAWGITWIAVGVGALASSRWPPASETWGYAVMTWLATWWSCCYFAGVALGAENQSTSGGLVWALVAFLWWAVAGLVNPQQSVCVECEHVSHEPEGDDLA